MTVDRHGPLVADAYDTPYLDSGLGLPPFLDWTDPDGVVLPHGYMLKKVSSRDEELLLHEYAARQPDKSLDGSLARFGHLGRYDRALLAMSADGKPVGFGIFFRCLYVCQTASKTDPRSASNFDPLM